MITETEILWELKKLNAVTPQQACKIFFLGNDVLATKHLSYLESRGLISRRRHDGVEYLTLTPEGAKRIKVDYEPCDTKRIGWLLSRSGIYADLICSGINRSFIYSRRKVLESENIDPKSSILVWMVDTGRGKAAVHLPLTKRYYSKAVCSINSLSHVDLMSVHILVVADRKQWYKDRNWFMNHPKFCSTLFLWEQSEFRRLFGAYASSVDPAVLGRKLLPLIFGAGILEKSPLLSPAPFLYRRRKGILFGDLRFNDVILAGRVARMTKEKMQDLGVVGTVLLMRDRAHCLQWAKAFSLNGSVYFLTENGGFFEPRKLLQQKQKGEKTTCD